MNKKIKRIIVSAIALSLTLTSVAFAKPYKGLPYGQYKKIAYYFDFKDAADYMNKKGIIKGYGNGDFGFDDNVKRGDIVVMISRAFNINKLVTKYADKFEDIDKEDYYYEAIQAARALGIAKGDGRKFGPKNYVTNEEAIAFVARTAAFYGYDEEELKSELEELYKDELKEKAKRKELANMLYYVLTNEEYKDDKDDKKEELDLEVIEVTVDEDEVLRFDEEISKNKNLIDKIDSKVKGDLTYVKFGKVENGKLYEEYDGKSPETLINLQKEYYVNPKNNQKSLSEVTFVPTLNYNGTASIEFVAYNEKGTDYIGKIEISIIEDYIIDTIKLKTTGAVINFDLQDKLEDLNEGYDFKTVIFTNVPTDDNAKLYILDSNDKVVEEIDDIDDKEYKISQLNNLKFIPYDSFDYDEDIEFKVIDSKGKEFIGKIDIIKDVK